MNNIALSHRNIIGRLLALAVSVASGIASADWDSPIPVRGEDTEKLYKTGSDTSASIPVGSVMSPRFGEIPYGYFCQTIDSRWDTPSHLELMYTPESYFGPYGESATAELDTTMRFLGWDGFMNGMLEGDLHVKMISYMNDAEIDALPDAASQVNLDVFATWRFENFWLLELGAAPGMYSDVASPSFACPFTINFHRSLGQTASFVIGATGRIGWDMPVMPNVGLAWEPFGFFRIEAALPRSTVELSLFDTVNLFGTIEWRNFDFALDDVDGLPESYTVDEWIATVGLFISPSADGSGIGFEFGKYLKREISSDDVSENGTIELDKEWIARFSWHGGF